MVSRPILLLLVAIARTTFAAATVGSDQIRSNTFATFSRATRRDSPVPELQYFDQLIDHFPHSPRYKPHENRTFKHRYRLETSYYKNGGPVFLYINGEYDIEDGANVFGDGFLVQNLVQRYNGIGIALEIRGYGKSWPYNSSTTDELRYLTTEQIIADIVYFKENFELPSLNGTLSKAPWVLLGASYPGALTAFTVKTHPDTFVGGIASSALIHGEVEYPGFYDPIQLFAPQDCVASINDIVDKMDTLVRANNTVAIEHLKSLFGLSALQDIRDFAQTIAFPIGGPFNYPIATWQEINWVPKYARRDFFDFCRNVTDINAPPNVTSMDYVLSKYTNGAPWRNLGNYAAYIKRVVLPVCENGDYNSASCFGTQDPDFWADLPTGKTARMYLWTTCTELGLYQAAYPVGKKSLISRVIDKEYTQQWCEWAFPKGKYNHLPASPDVDAWNSYGGYNFSAKKLLFVDGTIDPFREASYHAARAPQRYWTQDTKEMLITGAGHSWDFFALEDIEEEPDFIREAHYLELRTVETWLKEFRDGK